MKPSAYRPWQLACIFCAVLAIAPALPAGPLALGVAQAQESGQRSGVGLLRFLFPSREQPKQERVAPPETQQRRPAATTRRAAQPAAPAAAPAVDKAENARKILVIGDFMASGLAEGLSAAYLQNPNVAVIDRANGSSGLVRNDHYDWPGNIAAVIDSVQPAAVVVMIGSNDRQQMLVRGNHENPRSEAWNAEYERRVSALVKAVRDKDLPLIWVGNLPFRSPAMSSDMIAFNDIYRRVASDAGGEFIDVWDGFVDESGTFAAAGPDMNGQPAQLRGSDGINVSRQGRRKIAFYVEKPLARLVDIGDGDGSPRLEEGDMPATLAPKDGVPALIDRTPPAAIDDFGVDGGSALLGAHFAPRNGVARTPAQRLTRDGVAPDPQPGRADDFMARRPVPASAQTP